MGERSRRVTLGEVARKLASGATPRGGSSVYIDRGIALIRSQNIYDSHFTYTGLAHIDDRAAHALDAVAVAEDDVLLNITGDSVARCCLAPRAVLPARVNQHVMIIRPDPDALDSRYLQFLLVAPRMKSYLLTIAGAGATRPALTKAHIAGLELDLPPLSEQRAIAEVLGALDDKIEANRRFAATVDALAKAEVEAAQATADRVLPLGDLLRRVTDIAQPAELAPATVYIGLEHMPRGSLFLTEWGVVEGLASAKAQFQPGDILFGKLRPYFKKVAVAPSAGVCSTDVLVLRPRHSTQRAFGLVVCASDGVINYASSGSHGTRMPRVSWEYLSAWQVPVPGAAAMQALEQRVEPMLQHAVHLTQESALIAQLRDALLPKLLSGEVRVRDAETVFKGAI